VTKDQARVLVTDILAAIAPEADLSAVRDDEDLREALDLDSMDILNMVTALHERTGRAIPEEDTPRLLTLAGIAAYFAA
jgi:acyl carrier protein